MKFEFAKYTDVTKFAKEISKENYGVYDTNEKILICPDTHDAWVARITLNCNEAFEYDENKVLIERNNIDGMGARWADITVPIAYCRKVLNLDIEEGLSNWDMTECSTLDEALDMLDGGFGIIKEDA